MILIQIDLLSDSELQAIAEQEGIKDWSKMGRQELIDCLREIYEEDDDYGALEAEGDDFNKKFVAGLTDYRGSESEVKPLPGVGDLPEAYSDTSIHVLLKNATWLYCYWSIAPLDEEKLKQKYGDYSLLISVEIICGDKAEESFDISVSKGDSEWNINVPHKGGKCHVSLKLLSENGEAHTIASAKEFELLSFYWLEHPEEIKRNSELLRKAFSLVTTKEGKLSDCGTVKEIADAVFQEM